MTLCAALILTFAATVSAGPTPAKNTPSTISTFSGNVYDAGASVAGKVYSGGSEVLDRTEGIVSGCLRRTFSFFNPCLDLFKGCTSIVLMPIEKPIEYLDKRFWTQQQTVKPAESQKQKKPALQK